MTDCDSAAACKELLTAIHSLWIATRRAEKNGVSVECWAWDELETGMSCYVKGAEDRLDELGVVVDDKRHLAVLRDF